MKNKLHILWLLLIFTSCQSIKFDRYPGKMLTEIPDVYQGKYLYVLKDKSLNDTVTVFVSKSSFSIIGKSNTSIQFLDTNNVFSNYNYHDFMFVKDGEFWSGFNIEKSNKGINVIPFLSPTGTNFNKNKKVLSKYFNNVNWIKSTNKMESGTFSANMNEDNLLKYIRKNRRFSIKLLEVKD